MVGEGDGEKRSMRGNTSGAGACLSRYFILFYFNLFCFSINDVLCDYREDIYIFFLSFFYFHAKQ